MSNSKQNIEARKQELKEQLDDIEESLDSSVYGMKEDVSDILNPRKIIKKYPLESLGVSFLVGFLVANSSTEQSPSTAEKKSPSLLELVWGEAKKDVSKKVVRIFLNYLDAKTSGFDSSFTDNSEDENKNEQ